MYERNQTTLTEIKICKYHGARKSLEKFVIPRPKTHGKRRVIYMYVFHAEENTHRMHMFVLFSRTVHVWRAYEKPRASKEEVYENLTL